MLLSLIGLAAAAPVTDASTDAIYQAYLRTFESAEAPGWGCATGLLLALRERWPELSPAQRARVAARLSPGAADPWSAPGAPPPGTGRDTCWGQSRDHRVTSEHFAVDWMDGVTDEETALQLIDDLEYAWEVAFEQRGWRRPEGTDAYLMQVIIEPGGAGAYTTIKACGDEYHPYIVAGEGSFSSERWARNMAAHELLHTSQFAYSYAHEFWWWEASATWFEEYAHPEDNAWSESIPGYSLYPHMAMNAFSQTQLDVFAHMYGMAVWGFYLDEYLGGHDLVRATWEHSAGVEGSYTLGMPETIEALGYDFDEVYAGFAAATAVMDYADQDAFLPPYISELIDELPAAYTASGGLPEPLGQVFLRVDAGAATDALPDLEVAFSGDSDRRWLVQLVAEDADRVQAIVPAAIEAGEGVAELRDFGDYDYIWVVASPLDGEGGAGFSLAAAAVELPALDTGDGAVKGCACSSSRAGGWAALWLLALPLAALRRRE